ncbi:Endopolyphosphatase [Grifola frondosa]|uniref:Endopolyphosphatase n=1 Tax=Grifola frondosa TaxID=5627 RepID=A0A1C7MIC4_GRIFR|nr:Endopolyphosphatase [Grifola frondosa]
MLESKLLLVLLLSLLPNGLAAPAAQVPLEIAVAHTRRKLQGRFLHITDTHPDPYYRVDAAQMSACHRRKPKRDPRRSGYYGMPYGECDSPMTLTNYTLDFLDKEWSADIDFVICNYMLPDWDSARHDNDRMRPRTTAEIYALNRAMAKKMEDVFVSKGIPVIPSIGNNDVWRQQLSLKRSGPNSITSEFSSIWKSFVPFNSYQVFQRGGYFSVEVIPDSVAVISLNTMYFYDSNTGKVSPHSFAYNLALTSFHGNRTAVGGCEYTDPQDPGNLQFDWLSVQLEMFRRRGMQVWLTGHVPPSSRNFFPECYVRYVELSLRYQDTILGHLFGHMNADHFFLLDAEHLGDDSGRRNLTSDLDLDLDDEGLGLKKKHKELYDILIKDFSDLPKTSRTNHDNYGVVNVAPSVVPNPYLPSFRIFVYNVTGVPYRPGDLGEVGQPGWQLEGSTAPEHCLRDSGESLCARARYQNTWRCNLCQPWHSNPNSPSRTNALWSPLGYAQYYLPDLEDGNEKHAPKYKLEYLTFPVSRLHPAQTDAETKFSYPIPLRHLPRSLRNATVTESKFAPYGLVDLTIGSWTELAQRLGKKAEKKLQKRFRKYMYMGVNEG